MKGLSTVNNNFALDFTKLRVHPIAVFHIDNRCAVLGKVYPFNASVSAGVVERIIADSAALALEMRCRASVVHNNCVAVIINGEAVMTGARLTF